MDTGNSANYKQTGADKILGLLRTTFGDKFKTYYNGDPEAIPQSALPAITANITRQRIDNEATGVDIIIEDILVKMILNKKDDFGAAANSDLTEVKLRRMAAGQDATTGQWLEGTLMYTLRTQITLNDTTVGQNIAINYDVNLRPDDVVTMEAWAEISVSRFVQVPQRS